MTYSPHGPQVRAEAANERPGVHYSSFSLGFLVRKRGSELHSPRAVVVTLELPCTRWKLPAWSTHQTNRNGCSSIGLTSSCWVRVGSRVAAFRALPWNMLSFEDRQDGPEYIVPDFTQPVSMGLILP